MEETYLLNHPGVKKKILAGGAGPLPHFLPGTKLVFHFQTLLDNFERTVIDDSRLAHRPAEIFVGKMFKMEVWETLLTSMRVGEVAEFWCDAIHTGLYPIVSKGMRLIAQGRDPLEGQKHMCGMGNLFHYHSTGFPELDELMRTPQPLIFIMELLQVGDPMSYHRESWMMEKDEKLQAVPLLHMQGNALVKQRQFREAASKYKEAVLLLKTVQSREMPGDVDYINLGRMIIPLELNYCQCMLELEEYYEVIEHTTELLEKHKDCVKGYYKRAKAHAAVWNEKEAKRDFNMVMHLDVTLASLVHRELKDLSERIKEKYWEEKESYWNMLEKKENTSEGKEQKREGEMQVKVKEHCDDVTPVTTCESGEGRANKQSPSEGEGIKEREGETEETSEVSPKSSANTDEKDWQQMLRLVMLLQKEGNFLITNKQFEEASTKFKEAIDYVDFLLNKVDHGGEDWESLEKVHLPLTLNLSQCMLELEQYQRVVELNDKLLRKHKGNFKATYQRARAHVALCNEEEARRDLATVEKLDPKFKHFVRQELKKMGQNIRTIHAHRNKTYWDTAREKWGPDGSKAKARGTARQRNVKFTQATADIKSNMDKKTEGRGREKESSGKPIPSETEGVGDAETEKNPDVKVEQSGKDQEFTKASERLDNENTVTAMVQEDDQGAPDNGETDSDPGATSDGNDNVGNKRSGFDKGKKKVKCQSNSTKSQSRTSLDSKANTDITDNSTAQSDENSLQLSGAESEATGNTESRETI